jgi:hypothetical protein
MTKGQIRLPSIAFRAFSFIDRTIILYPTASIIPQGPRPAGINFLRLSRLHLTDGSNHCANQLIGQINDPDECGDRAGIFCMDSSQNPFPLGIRRMSQGICLWDSASLSLADLGRFSTWTSTVRSSGTCSDDQDSPASSTLLHGAA